MAESDIDRILRKIKERDIRMRKKRFYNAKMKREEKDATDSSADRSD
jgi:hypothetical protein